MVDLEVDDGLAIITIDRPHARNAISLETMDQLEQALEGADGAAALVLTGGGDRAFVSGGDLKELSALRTEEQAAAMAFRMRSICDRIAGFPAPVVAALNGHALGGGAEFAVAADIRIAADDIKIGFNQVALKIMPAWGGAERLVELVGYGRGPAAGRHRTHPQRSRGRADRPRRPGDPAGLLRRAVATHRTVVGRHTGRRGQAGDARRADHGGGGGLRPPVGVRRALGRRGQGDEQGAVEQAAGRTLAPRHSL